MSDDRSLTTFVMAAQVPWPDDVPAADAIGTLDPVAMLVDGARQSCGIRRISSLGTTIRGISAREAGDPVTIELATGQRAAGIVDWAASGEAGIRFRQPIDMIALLNRKLVSQPGERRTMPRVELRCAVGVKWGASVAAATLRNISSGGLQVQGDGLPPRDTFVSLFVDGLNVPAGEIVWRKGDLAGIELMEELSWSSIMPWVRETMRRTAG
ncbi:PilZ domain-containing protein [Sphingomonas sp. LY160]|uniref:PilZ domain-containing protein n=1 Tax=Sphingomonas sp. LY160 TaxID=3095342 RepID=UPI002ADEDB74|nr:PilZ domain-containing protein [Sphingomonas sp. LY160]MEA1073041.1 PilZ domain-containing protein [Sphingomonas sp. LY160]